MVKFLSTILHLILFSVFWQAAYAVPLKSEIYDTNFRTIKVAPLSNSYFPPIWVMGQSDNPLIFSFDNISEDRKYLQYSILHCDSNWELSSLQESEYTNSLNYADIEDFEFSTNTFVHYVHYKFQLPNEDIQILRSGNYIVKVYEQENPDKVLFQTRFSVCENSVMVTTNVSSRTDIDYNENHQQLSVDIIDSGKIIFDPYNNLRLVVSQNSRLDNEVQIEHPFLVNGNKISYQHNNDLIFPAGNEFRRIETIATHSLSMGVTAMQYHEPYYHAQLRTDLPRVMDTYLYDKTQHGYFTIRNWDSDNSDTEADYIVTHFTLDTGGELAGGNIYLDGEFTQHSYTPSNLMRYDATTGFYTAELLLKQGAYNYQYLWVPNGSDKGYTSKLEGDKYQTVNEYLVKAYIRNPGDRYDRFVGFGIIFSGK